jgi:hypothetical protein
MFLCIPLVILGPWGSTNDAMKLSVSAGFSRRIIISFRQGYRHGAESEMNGQASYRAIHDSVQASSLRNLRRESVQGKYWCKEWKSWKGSVLHSSLMSLTGLDFTRRDRPMFTRRDRPMLTRHDRPMYTTHGRLMFTTMAYSLQRILERVKTWSVST